MRRITLPRMSSIIPTAPSPSCAAATAVRHATNIPMSAYLRAANSRFTGGAGHNSCSLQQPQFRDKHLATMDSIKEQHSHMRAEEAAKKMRARLNHSIMMAERTAEAKNVQAHRRQLVLTLKQLRQLRDTLNSIGDFDSEGEERTVILKVEQLMGAIDILTLRAASGDEIVEIIQAASFFDLASSEAVSYGIQLLMNGQRKQQLKIKEILILLDILSGVPNTGNPDTVFKRNRGGGAGAAGGSGDLQMQSAFRTHYYLELMAVLLGNTKVSESLTPRHYDQLLRMAQLDTRQITPANIGEQLTKRVIERYHSDTNFQLRSTINHVARVASCITQFRINSKAAAQFFVDTEKLVRDFVDGLKGYQLGHLLVAYATVGYPNTELFMLLGQKAGDMGEELSDHDAARVLTALDTKKELDTTKLRASLESSMRIKEMVQVTPRRKVFRRQMMQRGGAPRRGGGGDGTGPRDRKDHKRGSRG